MNPNYGAPAPGSVRWHPSAEEVAAIKAGGRVTEAARWDNATPEQRKLFRPDFNPHKRWFEQAENRAVRL